MAGSAAPTTLVLRATVGTLLRFGPEIVTVAVCSPFIPDDVNERSKKQLAPAARVNGGALGQLPLVAVNSEAFVPLTVMALTC